MPSDVTRSKIGDLSKRTEEVLLLLVADVAAVGVLATAVLDGVEDIGADDEGKTETDVVVTGFVVK